MGTTEGPSLYGRDPLLRALVPRLTGLAHDERSRTTREHQGDPPVVLVTGRHGMGRSAVLAELAAHYRGRLPLAHIRAVPPTAEPVPSAPSGPGVPAVAADTVELLAELVCALAPDLRRRFPVLLPGLFAVAGWRYDNDEERDARFLLLARALIACHLERGPVDPLRHAWAAAVEGRLDELDHAERQDGITAAVIAEYAERHQLGEAPAWYRGRIPHSGDSGSPLLRLGEWFQLGGDYRHAAEQALTAALLHDIAAAYGRLQRWNREPWPLILLDDAHTETGEGFLELLLEQRARPDRPHREETVVVATRLGELPDAAADAVRRDLADLVKSSGWRRTGPTPYAGLLAVPLTPLSRDDVLPLLAVARSARPLHPYLASAVHSLTGGHPAATTMLCAAVLHTAKKGTEVTPRTLLELTTKDGRPVTEALLERLLPDRRQRDRLTLLSLARDNAAASALAAHLRLEGPEQLPANAVTEYLESQQWQQLTLPDRPLVSDTLLQTLLVHEARRRSAGADDRRGWQEVHRFLRMHHAQRGADGEADALRHTLAAGEADTVVAALAEEFQSEQDEQGAAHWLFCLQYAATAPTPPARDWADERMALALGAHDGRFADLHETERCVNRLLHALWYLSEPHTEPDTDLCKAVGEELAYLSPRHPSWHAVLSQAARSWPTAARKRQPFPIPRQ
ncbi:ATP-binding protein [Streptomyces monticola]|uniref:ATP-binding protein n=1 Tax=Streptomyces monticola TaxID=2666263 RepID=A0ABW2JDN9_9ACTN